MIDSFRQVLRDWEINRFFRSVCVSAAGSSSGQAGYVSKVEPLLHFDSHTKKFSLVVSGSVTLLYTCSKRLILVKVTVDLEAGTLDVRQEYAPIRCKSTRGHPAHTHPCSHLHIWEISFKQFPFQNREKPHTDMKATCKAHSSDSNLSSASSCCFPYQYTQTWPETNIITGKKSKDMKHGDLFI